MSCRLFAMLKDDKIKHTLGFRLREAASVQQPFGPHAISLIIYDNYTKAYRNRFIFNMVVPLPLKDEALSIMTGLCRVSRISEQESINSDFIHLALHLDGELDPATLKKAAGRIDALADTLGRSAFYTGYGKNVRVWKDTVRADKFFQKNNLERYDGTLGGYHLRYATKEDLGDPQNAHGFPSSFYDCEGNYTLLLTMGNGQITNDKSLLKYIDNYAPSYLKGREALILNRSSNVDTNLQGLAIAIHLREQVSKLGLEKGFREGFRIANSMFDGPYTLCVMTRYLDEPALVVMTSSKNLRPIYIGHPLDSKSVAVSSSEDALIKAFPEGVKIESLPEECTAVFTVKDHGHRQEFSPVNWVMSAGRLYPPEFIEASSVKINAETGENGKVTVNAPLLKEIEISTEISGQQLRDYLYAQNRAAAKKESFNEEPEIEKYFSSIEKKVDGLFGVKPERSDIILASECGLTADVSPLSSGIFNRLIDKLGESSDLKELVINRAEAPWFVAAGKSSGSIRGKQLSFSGKKVTVFGSLGSGCISECDDLEFHVRQIELPDGRLIQGNAGEHLGASSGEYTKIIVEGDCMQNAGIHYRGFMHIKGKSGARTGKSLKGGILVVKESVGIDSFEWMNSGIAVVGWKINKKDKFLFPARRLGTGMKGGIIYFGGSLSDISEHGEDTIVTRLIEEDISLIKRIFITYGINLHDFGDLKNYLKIIPKHMNIRDKTTGDLVKIENFGVEITAEHLYLTGSERPESGILYADEETLVRRQLKFNQYLSGQSEISQADRKRIFKAYKNLKKNVLYDKEETVRLPA